LVEDTNVYAMLPEEMTLQDITEFLMDIPDLGLSQILLSKERVLTIELGEEEDVLNLLQFNPLFVNGFTIALSRVNMIVDEFMGMDPKIATLMRWISKSQSILVFSGYINELGFNDFGNEDNLGDFTLENILFNQPLQRKYWKYHDNMYTKITYSEIHPIHKFVFNLDSRKRNLLAVVNQSVDNLFERGDVTPYKILHLNGREFYPFCFQCNTAYDRNKIYTNNQENMSLNNDEETFTSPLCETCNVPLIIESSESLDQTQHLRELTEKMRLNNSFWRILTRFPSHRYNSYSNEHRDKNCNDIR